MSLKPEDGTCNPPFERTPQCACDLGTGEPPTKMAKLECYLRRGPCHPGSFEYQTPGSPPEPPKPDICHCGRDGYPLHSTSCPVHGKGWRPIETAPRSGHTIWVANHYFMRLAFWKEGPQYEYLGSVGGGWRDYSKAELRQRADLQFAPLYWQPLPEPPKP
jgi:hypothetical protein